MKSASARYKEPRGGVVLQDARRPAIPYASHQTPNAFETTASQAFSRDSNPFSDASDVPSEHILNYEMYGNLRNGAIVKFYSMECLGLLAATYTSAFSYQCLQGVTRPLMRTQLDLTSQENVAVQRLVELPMALSFFVGLLADSYPIMGLRRKGYMVLGLLLNAVSVVVLAGLSAHFEAQGGKDRSQALVVLAIIMVSLASFGCIITYICVHTRVIELSQREPLRMRGTIQADYLIFRRLTSLTASTFNYLTVGSTTTPHLAFSKTMLILASICVLPLPLILKFWREEHYSLPMNLKVRAQIFWKIMQQKAVWRVLMFIIMYGIFLAIKFNDPISVIRNWTTGAARDNQLVTRTIQDVMWGGTILVWRQFFMNTGWRKFFCWAPIFTVFPQLLASILVALDVERDRYLYRTLVSISQVSDGITALNNVVPLTEIIQEGSEGATVGLTLSLQRLVSIFVNTNAQGLFRGENFYSTSEVKLDSSHVRWDVLQALFLNYVINLIALFGLVFLPSQKLDAQRQRMYGGFTKAASSIIVIAASLLFLYSLAINVMTFVPSLSCIQLAGGSGCH
ncbi:hypothetical protein Poli38472_009326 [Pythium oligandrum]|uniref:Transmembrane protein n=1 Tax=Pythium oligandrum TaxID=41045 RepID=A0A8K1FLD8_PYTOL|nr:hypothetical protein Poli38472_009326 [Pythium oligandrum]|eukprot:TMW65159.1 hypothetical protein Poli38472_009326 [Pythium oligandrum]